MTNSIKIINLTPHDVVIKNEQGTIVFPPSENVARVTTEYIADEKIEIAGMVIPVDKRTFGVIEGLPDPQQNTKYIVSTVVALAAKGIRDDLIVPDTTNAERDENGNILSIPKFVKE